jgi:hypothetical protein
MDWEKLLVRVHSSKLTIKLTKILFELLRVRLVVPEYCNIEAESCNIESIRRVWQSHSRQVDIAILTSTLRF